MINAICQRRGHIASKTKPYQWGLPICQTCGQPFDDDDGQPSLILSSFNDPDDRAATLCRRPAQPASHGGHPALEFTDVPTITFSGIDSSHAAFAASLANAFTQGTGQIVRFIIKPKE